jgi:hypothetical protein
MDHLQDQADRRRRWKRVAGAEALVAPLFELVESPGASEAAAGCPAGTAECPECAGNAVHTLTVYGQGEVRQLAFTEECLDLAGPLRSALDAVASQGQ